MTNGERNDGKQEAIWLLQITMVIVVGVPLAILWLAGLKWLADWVLFP